MKLINVGSVVVLFASLAALVTHVEGGKEPPYCKKGGVESVSISCKPSSTGCEKCFGLTGDSTTTNECCADLDQTSAVEPTYLTPECKDSGANKGCPGGLDGKPNFPKGNLECKPVASSDSSRPDFGTLKCESGKTCSELEKSYFGQFCYFDGQSNNFKICCNPCPETCSDGQQSSGTECCPTAEDPCKDFHCPEYQTTPVPNPYTPPPDCICLECVGGAQRCTSGACLPCSDPDTFDPDQCMCTPTPPTCPIQCDYPQVPDGENCVCKCPDSRTCSSLENSHLDTNCECACDTGYFLCNGKCVATVAATVADAVFNPFTCAYCVNGLVFCSVNGLCQAADATCVPECPTCPGGGSTDFECPAGTICTRSGTPACGAAKDCEPCDYNTYTAYAGATECFNCTVGFVASRGSTGCAACPFGFEYMEVNRTRHEAQIGVVSLELGKKGGEDGKGGEGGEVGKGKYDDDDDDDHDGGGGGDDDHTYSYCRRCSGGSCPSGGSKDSDSKGSSKSGKYDCEGSDKNSYECKKKASDGAKKSKKSSSSSNNKRSLRDNELPM